MSGYRTNVGDVLRDERTGQQKQVVAVWRGEDISRFIDGTGYRQRADERSALYGGHRTNPKAGR